jgi:hypothetical protein
MTSGNYLADYYDAQDTGRICPVCDGNGATAWQSREALHDALMLGLADDVSFREYLRQARIIRDNGQFCSRCNGGGYV